MSVLIKGLKMPKCEDEGVLIALHDGKAYIISTKETKEAVELPDHGDLIDRDAFRKTMYHDTFETDSDLQKWESGCWIRYKMFERNIKSAPVVIPAERSEE